MPKPFDLVRTQLDNQYQGVQFGPASGGSGEGLGAALARHLPTDIRWECRTFPPPARASRFLSAIYTKITDRST